MAYFNEENTVEQMLINAAGQCGWIYVEPQFVPRLPDEVLVVEWLMEALLALNPITAYSGGYPFSISGDIRSVPS